ncbi:hypothetical protein [Anoxynatronum sibiricum]|uniref:Uncharacterized protein n=1 Tax=Anoxynatronum sibiricum TaxID=210623 RepID=A0ABU9VX40_9CLOT
MYDMKADKRKKVEQIEEILVQKGLYFERKANGHYRIDGVSYWATTEKFIDHVTGEKGVGLNRFLKHIQA